MTETSRRIMGELVKLNTSAETHWVDALHKLNSAHPDKAVPFALLAIERRLAMVALFVIAAMEEDDHETD